MNKWEKLKWEIGRMIEHHPETDEKTLRIILSEMMDLEISEEDNDNEE